jgi:hypothetical protein
VFVLRGARATILFLTILELAACLNLGVGFFKEGETLLILEPFLAFSQVSYGFAMFT